MDYKNYNPRAAALAQARTLLTDAVKTAVADGTLPEAALPDFIVEIPADVKNGDIASNVAMAGARAFHKAPRQIAEAITAKLQLDGSLFDRFEVAGPGFINLFLGQDWFTSVVRAAVANPEYGRTDAGAGKKYNVEFVSANPTGPMHMGNARGGALGDGLAACLDWAGYDVTREFYINDAGNQIEKFGKSLAIRYLQLYKGEDACPLPEECYQGADIITRAKEFAEVHGDAYVNKDFDELKKAIDLALENDRKVVFEAFVDGQEVECAVIGSDPAVSTRPGEILAGAEFYTYDDKYKNGVSQVVIPARLSEEKLDEVKTYAAMAYTALNCEGLARCDFFVEHGTNRVMINEINTFPGFTPISMYPKLMEHEGTPVPALIDHLIELALERTEKQHG